MRRRILAIGALVAAALATWLVLKPGGVLGPADRHGAHVSDFTIDSKAVGAELPVSVVVPAGSAGDGRPLLIFLHGRGADEHSEEVGPMFAALSRLGKQAPVVAFPYGGDHSYWHDRAGGDWADYVTDEVIPQVTRRFHTAPDRVAIGGISMGGFGAYDIAVHDPGSFCAVGGHSPALWQSADETAEGAFDDATDFAQNDVIAAANTDPGPFVSQPLWLDAGDSDPFQPGDEAFIATLRADGANLTTKTWPGGHESEYWNSHWPSYLRFYAKALETCNE